MEFFRKLLFSVFSNENDDEIIRMEDPNSVELPELHLSPEEIESLLPDGQTITDDQSKSQLNNYVTLTVDEFNTNNIQKKYNTDAVVSRNVHDEKENLDFFGILDNMESLPSQTHTEALNERNDINIMDLNSMINNPNMWPHKNPKNNEKNNLTWSEAVLYDYNSQQLEKEFLDFDSKISSTLLMKKRVCEVNPEVISINSSVPSSPIKNDDDKDIIFISSDDESTINTELNIIKSNEKEISVKFDSTEHSVLKTQRIEMIANILKETSDNFLKNDFEKDLADLNEKEGLETFIKDPYDSDAYNGYVSSDFEIITESDAELDAPLKHFKHNIILKVRRDNEAGPSNFKNDDTVKKLVAKMVEVRENHEEPDEEQFLYLFGGPPVPAYSFEGDFKSMYSFHPTPMNIEYEGVGFDMAQEQIVDDDENARHEAENVRILILAEQLVENSNINDSNEP